MITTLHLANFMMLEESLMWILNRQDVTLTKNEMLLLLNIMLAKVPGPINGKTSMLLFVESCSNMALSPLITMTSKTSTMQIVSMKFASKEREQMMKRKFRASLTLSEVNTWLNYVPQRKSL